MMWITVCVHVEDIARKKRFEIVDRVKERLSEYGVKFSRTDNVYCMNT